MTAALRRRLAGIESTLELLQRTVEARVGDFDHDAILAEWRRLRALPEPPPRPLPPEIARLSDAEAMDLYRRLAKGQEVRL